MPFKYTTKMLFMQAKLKRKHMPRMYFTYILNKEPKKYIYEQEHLWS